MSHVDLISDLISREREKKSRASRAGRHWWRARRRNKWAKSLEREKESVRTKPQGPPEALLIMPEGPLQGA
jgi:hypothetical protein